MLGSVVCRQEDFSAGWYAKWSDLLPLERYGLERGPSPQRPHRKVWEWCAIAQALEERGMLAPGRRGCGFAVGMEPLPSLFASLGADILATDQPITAEADEWAGTNQHAAGLDAIHFPQLLERGAFDRLVHFRPVDMRALGLPWHMGAPFDFLWSSCAMEHLGTLQLGIDFVMQSLALLRPGGVAVHTTEFNVGSDDDTLESGGSVVYRARDILDLDRRLRHLGCGLARPDLYAGDGPLDLDYDTPPYRATGPHIKLLLDGHVCTSVMLIVQKGLGPARD